MTAFHCCQSIVSCVSAPYARRHTIFYRINCYRSKSIRNKSFSNIPFRRYPFRFLFVESIFFCFFVTKQIYASFVHCVDKIIRYDMLICQFNSLILLFHSNISFFVLNKCVETAESVNNE